ncbi:phage terminase large subunit [Bacillus thuringiensis]|uniref:phage terminase large subunit n=1 Tax=Bacillus thuringiensis TaxID=1428 RepID=UPI001CB96177|nr:phage terminase large subunit [Bacillus thuringiensis]
MITKACQNLLEDKLTTNRLMVFMPPRHSKSQSITETLPSWYLGCNPNKRVIEVSYAASLAEKFGRRNRAKVEEFGQEIFGISIDERQASVTDWAIQGKLGGMLSVGVGGSITGEGADLMIVDDPIKNRQEAESTTYRNRLWDEWEDTLSTRLQKGAKVILILTRWHEDDLAGRLLEKEPEKWTVLSIPAVADTKDDPLGREIGQGLWVSHYGQEYYDDKKDSSSARSWLSLWQQKPSSDTGSIFKRKWMQYYDVLPKWEEFDQIITSWDMAFDNATSNSSYVVGQIWGKINADKYLIDQVRAQMNFPETKKAFEVFHNKYETIIRNGGFKKSIPKLVEKKANGPAIISSLKSEISGIIPISPQGSKEARAEAISPEFQSGNIYIPNPKMHTWVHDYIDEMVSFPSGKHDDQVDTTSQALEHFFTKPKKVMGGKVKRV